MPGVVTMENGVQNGISTNHDRDLNAALNGNNGVASGSKEMANGSMRMNDLPDEIQHITQGYVPLGLLLSRLAQRTHNQLQGKVLELAKMPAPMSALNGNSSHSGNLPDDTSGENLSKKASLLKFIQDTHAKWTKALVITAWSRKAPTVSKLVDLWQHINMQRMKYNDSLEYLINIKRDLTFARLPNPDLETALQVLSTGDASWMPDLNYIEPPPMKSDEILEWIEELNTLLSIRLNVDDHNKIPYQFRDYSIESGRVTFRVQGEFEVDLTIADEDFEKQFWFIDFRFLFTPAPVEITDRLRMELEFRVNESLAKDGLQGCYNLLHEFVLTHKITEFFRQAEKLAKGAWVDTLKVERLNRAMSVQYWATRYLPEGPKSWIILGVHSGRTAGMAQDPRSTSHLTLRWFKDNKEVKDVVVSFDDANISTEALLKRVIAHHVEQILSAIDGKLQTAGRFQRREATLSLNISLDEPVESELKMQMGHKGFVSVRISPTTGLFSITPQTGQWPLHAEGRLNFGSRDPIEDGPQILEYLRYRCTSEEMNRRGKSMGWVPCKVSVKMDELRALLRTKEVLQPMWFKRKGWPPQWHLLLTLSLSGDSWWLLEVTNHPTGPRISMNIPLQLTLSVPAFTDRFFSNLTIFSAAVMSRAINLKAAYERHIKYKNRHVQIRSLPPGMKVPAVLWPLSELLRSRHPMVSKRVASWAYDVIQVTFREVERPRSRRQKLESTINGSQGGQSTGISASDEPRLLTVIEARFQVKDPAKFSLLKGNVERDVAFNPSLGLFALRLKSSVGTTILDALAHRLQAIARLVDCVDAIRRSKVDIECETITLNKIVFTYSDAIGRSAGSTVEANIHRWKASLDLRGDRIKMSLEKGNPHLRSLDTINQLLNSELGFADVPQYMAVTLPVHKAFDEMEDAWEDLQINNQGGVEIFPDYLDLFNIRYTLPTSTKTGSRRVTVSLKLQQRQNEPWWHLTRCEAVSPEQPDDQYKLILHNVWENENEGLWKSFVNSSGCEASDSVIPLLQKTDAAIREALNKVQSPMVTRQIPTPQPQAQTQTQTHAHAQAQSQAQIRNQAKVSAYRARPQQGHVQQQQGNVVILDD